MKNGKANLNDYIRKAVILALFFGLFLFIMILILTSNSFNPIFDLSSKGQVGDTIGGITAPFIGVVVAALTFLAFFMQFKANETHNQQFDEQSLEKEREKHENKILYLIKQNRSIAESMSIGDNVEGVKCFLKMFIEFRAMYQIVKSFYGSEINNREVINMSFLLFYNGVGKTSNILNQNILKSTPRLEELLVTVDEISSSKTTNVFILKKEYKIQYDQESLNALDFKPFQGHMTRLGQYFRNLFHILSYTQSIDKKLILQEDKYELIKSLRSQLSSYEQILIYFNSLSLYGKPLQDNNFLNQYFLIKNIPIPLVDFAGDIHEFYPEIKFEWDEIIERAM